MNVAVALHRYRIARPKLVALDVVTPADLAAPAQFRRIDTDVPTVAVAREGAAKTVVEAMRLGASDVVSAPVHPRDLEAALATAQGRAADPA
jgi:DNA-binding NtrC family response regulator